MRIGNKYVYLLFLIIIIIIYSGTDKKLSPNVSKISRFGSSDGILNSIIQTRNEKKIADISPVPNLSSKRPRLISSKISDDDNRTEKVISSGKGWAILEESDEDKQSLNKNLEKTKEGTLLGYIHPPKPSCKNKAELTKCHKSDPYDSIPGIDILSLSRKGK